MAEGTNQIVDTMKKSNDVTAKKKIYIDLRSAHAPVLASTDPVYLNLFTKVDYLKTMHHLDEVDEEHPNPLVVARRNKKLARMITLNEKYLEKKEKLRQDRNSPKVQEDTLQKSLVYPKLNNSLERIIELSKSLDCSKDSTDEKWRLYSAKVPKRKGTSEKSKRAISENCSPTKLGPITLQDSVSHDLLKDLNSTSGTVFLVKSAKHGASATQDTMRPFTAAPLTSKSNSMFLHNRNVPGVMITETSLFDRHSQLRRPPTAVIDRQILRMSKNKKPKLDKQFHPDSSHNILNRCLTPYVRVRSVSK